MGRHFERGVALLNLGRTAEATKEFNQELAEDPNCAPAYAMRGLCLAKDGKFTEAEKSARTAVNCAPEWEFPHYCLSMIARARDDIRRAETFVRNAIRIEPTELSLVHLADILHATGRFKEALTVANECLARNPENSEGVIAQVRAMIALDESTVDEAKSLVVNALSNDPNNATLQYVSGCLNLYTNGCKEALMQLREARRLEPTAQHDDELVLVAAGRSALYVKWLDRFVQYLLAWSPRQRWYFFAVFGRVGFTVASNLWRNPNFLAVSLVAAFVFAANIPGLVLQYGWIIRIVGALRTRKENAVPWYRTMRMVIHDGVFSLVALAQVNTLAIGVACLPQIAFIATCVAINGRLITACSKSDELRPRIVLGALALALVAPAFVGGVFYYWHPEIAPWLWVAMIAISFLAGGPSGEPTPLVRYAAKY